ncbi:MAG: hypothetical protein Q9209_004909 [Squamulea sp. 1 TL-2023]
MARCPVVCIHVISASTHRSHRGCTSDIQPWVSVCYDQLSEDTTSLQLPHSPHSNSTLTDIPRIPGFRQLFTLDYTKSLRPIEVFQTAIVLLYDAAQRPWEEPVHFMQAHEQIGYNVVMLIYNPRPPEAPMQLKISHCVTAILQAVMTLTDSVIFCQLKSRLMLYSADGATQLGTLTITPLRSNSANAEENDTLAQDPNANATALKIPNGEVGVTSGRITDELDPHLTFEYHSLIGKPITAKDISLVILDAIASAAPYEMNAECKDLYAISPSGGAAIIIESTTDKLSFTYGNATRVLKRLYQRVVVPLRRWEEIWCVIYYDNQKFGELRMLRVAEAMRGAPGGIEQ